MAEPFVSEIRLVPFNFAPIGWAMCDGQLMSISQNTALFSLVGTNFGGDGRRTFGLPNLQGKTAMDAGSGAGLTPRNVGDTGGTATVTLQSNQLGAHSHTMSGDTDPGTTTSPANALFGTPVSSADMLSHLYSKSTPNITLDPSFIGSAGGGQAHNNLQPYLVLTYIIALQGIFPSRG